MVAPEKRWGIRHSECRRCQTAERPHYGLGYCRRCYDHECRPESWREAKRQRERRRYWKGRIDLLQRRARSDAMSGIPGETRRTLKHAEEVLDRLLADIEGGKAELL